jgi:hypothetical protein
VGDQACHPELCGGRADDHVVDLVAVEYLDQCGDVRDLGRVVLSLTAR